MGQLKSDKNILEDDLKASLTIYDTVQYLTICTRLATEVTSLEVGINANWNGTWYNNRPTSLSYFGELGDSCALNLLDIGEKIVRIEAIVQNGKIPYLNIVTSNPVPQRAKNLEYGEK